MFLAGHPSQGCFSLQSHRAPCYFFNKASFCPSDFSFIDDFTRTNFGKSKGRKITDVAREFDITHSVVSPKSFKTTNVCRRHGGVVLKYDACRRQTYRLSPKGTGAPQLSTILPVINGVVSITWTEQDWACVLFSDESRFSLSSDCRRQLIWREWQLCPENIGPISDNIIWAGIINAEPTCGCEWDLTGQRYIDVLLPHVRLFHGAVGDKIRWQYLLARFYPNFEVEHPGGRDLPPIFPFHQPEERTCGSTAIKSIPMPQMRYTPTITNIPAFYGIRPQALRYSSQRC
ncbi:hypothetical protein TNCV_3243751 [Trichonephila clavipes]|nr:hypothetical protein TNCV_3243751 [Trichonephila clavipes]